MKRALAIVLAATALAGTVATAGCRKKESAKTSDGPTAGLPTVRDDSDAFLLTWIDEKGDFHVEQRPKDVPLVGRDAVRIVDPAREEGTHGDTIFLADLRIAGPEGTYPVKSIPRNDFDKMALARRQKHLPTLAAPSPSTSAAPGAPPSPSAPAGPIDPPLPGHEAPKGRPTVIIYGASWCSACHDAAAYLKRKGITFVEKDIEEDPTAHQEMQAKLSKSGLRGGSIPVIDVRGTVMIGFSPRAIEEALGKPL